MSSRRSESKDSSEAAAISSRRASSEYIDGMKAKGSPLCSESSDVPMTKHIECAAVVSARDEIVFFSWKGIAGKGKTLTWSRGCVRRK